MTKNQPSTKSSRKKLLATLRKSLTSGSLVQVQRSVEPHEVLEGVVVELGGTWVLLAGIRDGAYLNGYHALRLQDLVRVEAHATFVPLLQRRQSWPPAAPTSCLDLSETRSIITAAVSLAGVVSVYREATRPGTLLMGAPVEWEKKSLWLLPITPEGRWEQFMDKIRLKDITQIGFGDDYERAVLELAGPLPSRSARHGQSAPLDTPLA